VSHYPYVVLYNGITYDPYEFVPDSLSPDEGEDSKPSDGSENVDEAIAESDDVEVPADAPKPEAEPKTKASRRNNKVIIGEVVDVHDT
jgi:hypothetical protein